MFRVPVDVQVPVPGSYISADEKYVLAPFHPPATNTLPSGRRAVEAYKRPTVMSPVRDQIPVAGL
jgi:hypothetical protein